MLYFLKGENQILGKPILENSRVLPKLVFVLICAVPVDIAGKSCCITRLTETVPLLPAMPPGAAPCRLNPSPSAVPCRGCGPQPKTSFGQPTSATLRGDTPHGDRNVASLRGETLQRFAREAKRNNGKTMGKKRPLQRSAPTPK